MENIYWSNVRKANEKKYQDQDDKERLLKIGQLPSWKVTIIIILVDVFTVYKRLTELIERVIPKK